jgi:hypothetical protein
MAAALTNATDNTGADVVVAIATHSHEATGSADTVIVDMAEEGSSSCCYKEEDVDPLFGNALCWATAIFFRLPLLLLFFPCTAVQVLFRFLCGFRCCFEDCSMSSFMFVHKTSVEFDYTHREVVLRKFMRFGFLCRHSLVREQRLPFDSIDSFKYDMFSYTKSGIIRNINYDSFHKPHWQFPDGYVILVAVKRPPGDARCSDTNDGFLSQAVPSCINRLTGAAPPHRLYSWPAFIRRSIFDGGDLLVIDYDAAGRDWNTPDDLDPDKVSLCMGDTTTTRSGTMSTRTQHTSTKAMSPREAEARLQPIVDRLNACLARAYA